MLLLYLFIIILIFSLHCTMCSLDSFFSFRPNEVRHVVKFHGYIAIKHIFIPARSIERKIEKIGFLQFSNSKLVIFPQLFPCSNYKIFPNIPRQQWGFDDSPVVATGHFLLQGYMTVQRAHCAVLVLLKQLASLVFLRQDLMV